MRNFCLLLLTAIGFSAPGAEIKINFNSFSVGETPTNFSSAVAGVGEPGKWEVVSDEAQSLFSPLMPQVKPTPLVARRHVLAQRNVELNEDRFPIFIYNGETFKNFKLTTQFKIISGVAEQMAGVVFRYQNASNFYVFRASALGRNLRFYKVVDGRFVDPSPAFNMSVSTNVWHTLTVQCEGNRINCSLDDKVMPSIQTPNTFASGKVGFWTMSDSLTYFGDTMIDYTPVIPPAQTLVRDIMEKYPRILGLRIYMPDGKGQMRIIASADKSEIGQSGTDAEKNTLEKGAIYYGHDNGKVAVDMPLNDRNGDPLAVVRVELKSYSLAETQDMVLDRVRIIINAMQKRVLSKQDLM